jgi:hypothetical protein
MIVIVDEGEPIELGTTETAPTVGIVDYSRRVTDDFGVTTVVERGFARRMSVRLALPFEEVDGVQRLLADLRSTSAQWVADDRFAWLQPTGFYKDFEVDLAVPPISYCTLSVEGLAETASVEDAGEDPAPDNGASTLLMLRPAAVTDAVLVTSTVLENDAPVWGAGTTYPLGGQVIRTGAHRIYESLSAGNIGHDPVSSPALWLDVGPTNRWAMFDEALGTVTTTESGSIVVTLGAGPVSGVALLDVAGSSVQVEVIAAGETLPDYDSTVAVTGAAITFLDLPAIEGTVRVTIAGTAPVSVGTLLVGEVLGLGITEASPTAGISDFSKKQVDDFGEVTIVQRAWAKRMTARALISTDAIDVTADRIASVRARPVLWIGGAGLDSLTAYGFFRDFSIEVGETVSKLSLSIEGLSKAEALTTPWAADIASLRASIQRIASDGYLNAGEKPQAVIDYNAMLSNRDAMEGRYLAMGSPSDITPARTEAYDKIAALTAYLAGLAPSWTDATVDTPISAATYQTRWVEAYEALALFLAAITGRPGTGGTPGLNNAPVFAYQRSASGAPALPSATVTYDFAAKTLTGLNNGWTAAIPAGTNPLYITAATASSATNTDTIASGEWAAAQQWTKDGAPGADGLSTATVYLYQRNTTGIAPSAPSVTSTWTFATATLTGHNNGWTQTDPGEASGGFLFWTTATALALATASTDTIAAGEWAAVRRMAKDGDPGPNGLANIIVYAYQRSASGAPALPTATTTYDFSTKVLTGLNNGWSATVPAGTATLYITAATASSNTGSDTIAGSEWAAAQVWSGSGTPGDPGAPGLNTATIILLQRNNTGTAPAAPSATTTYTFATGGLTGINNGWSQEMPDPSAGKYLFWTQATALSTASTDTIAAGEWTAPKQVVKDGDQGTPGDPGDPGAPGVDGFTISPASKSYSISCTAGGTPKAGEFNKVVTFKVLQGVTDVSDDVNTTYSVSNTNVNATMGGTNSKVYTSTGMTAATGKSTVTIQRFGVTIATIDIDFTKNEDGSSATSGFDDTLNAMPNSTTLQLLGSFSILVANGATLSMSANVAYFAATGTYPGRIAISYQNVTDGGAETFSSEASGDITATTGEQAVASISGFTVGNGTGATKQFTVKLYGRRASGTGNSSGTTGIVEGAAG